MCITDAEKMKPIAKTARSAGRTAIVEARTLVNAILTDEGISNMSPEDARVVLKMTVRALNQAEDQMVELIRINRELDSSSA